MISSLFVIRAMHTCCSGGGGGETVLRVRFWLTRRYSLFIGQSCFGGEKSDYDVTIRYCRCHSLSPLKCDYRIITLYRGKREKYSNFVTLFRIVGELEKSEI